jgi:hypothetical protein
VHTARHAFACISFNTHHISMFTIKVVYQHFMLCSRSFLYDELFYIKLMTPEMYVNHTLGMGAVIAQSV